MSSLLLQLNRSQKGFTILEVMIAMAIFSIGILGVAKLQINATKGNSTARTYTEAVSFAQDKMELLLLLPYNNVLLADTDNDGTNQDLNNDGIDDNGGFFGLNDLGAGADHIDNKGIYKLTWNIAVDEPVGNSKRIRLFVTWKKSGSKEFVLNAVKSSI